MSAPKRSGRASAITAIGLTGAPAAPAEIPAGPPPATTPPQVSAMRPRGASAHRPREGEAPEPVVSYTLRLTTDEALLLDELTTAVRRHTRRRTDRAGILRTLLRLAETDPVHSELLRALKTPRDED